MVRRSATFYITSTHASVHAVVGGMWEDALKSTLRADARSTQATALVVLLTKASYARLQAMEKLRLMKYLIDRITDFEFDEFRAILEER